MYERADEVVDTLLDQEGLEVDPLDRLEGDTPLHKAVRFVNGLAKGEWEDGKAMVELLLDAGADPRLVRSIFIISFHEASTAASSVRAVVGSH